MIGTIHSRYWSLHGNSPPDKCEVDVGNRNHCVGSNVMAERNYQCDSHIFAYFGGTSKSLDAVGEEAFKEQLFHCMMSQTLWMKGEIEKQRATNTFGLLVSVNPFPLSKIVFFYKKDESLTVVDSRTSI